MLSQVRACSGTKHQLRPLFTGVPRNSQTGASSQVRGSRQGSWEHKSPTRSTTGAQADDHVTTPRYRRGGGQEGETMEQLHDGRPRCARCGHRARGCDRCDRDTILGGTIDGERYCHTEATQLPSCYQVALRERSTVQVIKHSRGSLIGKQAVLRSQIDTCNFDDPLDCPCHRDARRELETVDFLLGEEGTDGQR